MQLLEEFILYDFGIFAFYTENYQQFTKSEELNSLL